MSETTRITSYRDGPLVVRGPFRLEDQDGTEIDPGRDVVALCRCGRSRVRPFCDGSHKLVRFAAPSAREDRRMPARPADGPPAGEPRAGGTDARPAGLRDDAPG